MYINEIGNINHVLYNLKYKLILLTYKSKSYPNYNI